MPRPFRLFSVLLLSALAQAYRQSSDSGWSCPSQGEIWCYPPHLQCQYAAQIWDFGLIVSADEKPVQQPEAGPQIAQGGNEPAPAAQPEPEALPPAPIAQGESANGTVAAQSLPQNQTQEQPQLDPTLGEDGNGSIIAQLNASLNESACPANESADAGSGQYLPFSYYPLNDSFLNSMGTGPFSLTAWFRTGQPHEGEIIAWASYLDGRSWELRMNSEGTLLFSIGDADGSQQAETAQPYADGSWHFAAASRENGTAVLRVDGSEDANATLPHAMNLSGNGVASVGASMAYEQWFGEPLLVFRGEIANASVWNRSLTRQEAGEIWQRGR